MAKQKTTKLQPKSDFQKMLHENHHIRQNFGPCDDCPYCPQKPKR